MARFGEIREELDGPCRYAAVAEQTVILSGRPGSDIGRRLKELGLLKVDVVFEQQCVITGWECGLVMSGPEKGFVRWNAT